MNKYTERVNKLRLLFDENKIDALYISKPEDVSYFTGTKGDDLAVLVTGSDAFLITDFRYREMAQAVDWLTYCETSSDPAHLKTTLDYIRAAGCSFLGVCRNSLSLDLYLRFISELDGISVVPTGDDEYNIVNELRMIKDEEEIQLTHKAQDIGCEAFQHIINYIKPGMTENQVRLELEFYMLTHGAEALSFDTICVSGYKSSMPHGVPGEKIIETGEFITMDYGCTYKGYHSDMTRTVAVGSASDEMKNIYGIVLEAQLNACKNVKAGLTGDTCHNFALDVISKAGYGEYFGHGLGHGTGLEIHEAPRLSPSYKGIIPVNSIVSIEPGIYLPGKFGVRIEDLAVAKENGIINLTSAPKELIII